MARHGAAHWDVAAYALGVLDPAEVARCEAHLAECASCAAELETLLPTSKLLADVDIESLRATAEEPSFVDRILETVRMERRRLRLRRRITASVGTAAAAATAGFSLFAGSTWLAAAPEAEGVVEPPPATASPTSDEPGLGGPDLGEGEAFSAVDPATGVQADVLLDEVDWGTRVWLTLSALDGPLAECTLVLVRTDGTLEAAGSWRVPEEGYGNAAQPDPLQLPASTVTERADLSELRIVALDPADGTEVNLVTVPF